MEPNNQPPFNPKTPISAILEQEKAAALARQQKIANDPHSLQNELNPTTAGKPPETKTIIKTYESDIANAVKNQQASVAKIAIAEQTRRQKKAPAPTTSGHRLGIIVTCIILVVIGIAAVPIVNYFLNQQKKAVQVVADKTIVPFDTKDTLDITLLNHEKLIDALSKAPFRPVTPGTLDYIAMTETATDTNQNAQVTKASTSDFLLTIAPTMQPSLSRSFDGDYMYGTYTLPNSVSSPFLLLTTSSYDQSYAGMLHYEENILDDFGTLMKVQATTTPVFVDKIVQNKDARALTDANGNIIFMYAFLDSNTLMITTSDTVFKEVFSRFVASQFVQ